MTIRIVIADDEPLVRGGIAMLLSAETDMVVVGEAGDGAEAVELARRVAPDVVLMDLVMPHMDGVTAIRTLTGDEFPAHRAATVTVLVLTTFCARENVYEALCAGASGFLLKDSAPTDLATAVRVVAAGDPFLDRTVTRNVITDIVARPGPVRAMSGLVERLTNREREVLELMAYGMTNADIAERFVLSEATVRTHVCRILMKLEVRDRTQAVVAAYQNGLVVPRAGPSR